MLGNFSKDSHLGLSATKNLHLPPTPRLLIRQLIFSEITCHFHTGHRNVPFSTSLGSYSKFRQFIYSCVFCEFRDPYPSGCLPIGNAICRSKAILSLRLGSEPRHIFSKKQVRLVKMVKCHMALCFYEFLFVHYKQYNVDQHLVIF